MNEINARAIQLRNSTKKISPCIWLYKCSMWNKCILPFKRMKWILGNYRLAQIESRWERQPDESNTWNEWCYSCLTTAIDWRIQFANDFVSKKQFIDEGYSIITYNYLISNKTLQIKKKITIFLSHSPNVSLDQLYALT